MTAGGEGGGGRQWPLNTNLGHVSRDGAGTTGAGARKNGVIKTEGGSVGVALIQITHRFELQELLGNLDRASDLSGRTLL